MRNLATATAVLAGGLILGWAAGVLLAHILLAPLRAIARALIGGI